MSVNGKENGVKGVTRVKVVRLRQRRRGLKNDAGRTISSGRMEGEKKIGGGRGSDAPERPRPRKCRG